MNDAAVYPYQCTYRTTRIIEEIERPILDVFMYLNTGLSIDHKDWTARPAAKYRNRVSAAVEIDGLLSPNTPGSRVLWQQSVPVFRQALIQTLCQYLSVWDQGYQTKNPTVPSQCRHRWKFQASNPRPGWHPYPGSSCRLLHQRQFHRPVHH